MRFPQNTKALLGSAQCLGKFRTTLSVLLSRAVNFLVLHTIT